MTDLSQYSDEELERIAAGASASPTSFQIPDASAPAPTSKPLSEWTDEELEAYVAQSQGQGPAAQPAQETAQATPRKMTQEERIAANNRAIETARSQEDPGFLSAMGEALAEGARGAGRAVKAIGQGVLGTATSAVRLAGTPVRMATGWDGIHRLADKIDESYANFGRDALMSEYGENPDGWGYALGRAGEKVAGVAGSLAGLGAAGKAVQAASGAAKMAGLARTAKVAENALPLMFGNDAAVRAYDTARQNGKTRTEAAALAGLNGAIHFFGFKAFENQSLKKMLNIGPEVEVMMPKWANALAEEGGQSFSSLVRGTRNGMVKYIAAERGKGALKAGGIMGLQDMLSDPVMQVAEGADIDDIDFSRALKAGAHGVGEGALMEGLMGGAAIFKSQKAAEKFMADKYFRGKNYKVMGADGKMHDEPGLLNSAQGRMTLMKQNPDATTRVLDIVDHGGKPRPEELDAAFLPPDMTAEELRKFHDDWRKDLLNNMGIDPDAQPTPRLGYQINVGERPPSQEWQGAENPGIAFDELVRRGTAGQGRPETSPETTTQEKPNETGNGADEAPAQPEQGGVRQPQEGEVGKAETTEPPRGEAGDAGVVAPAEGDSQKLTGGSQKVTPTETSEKLPAAAPRLQGDAAFEAENARLEKLQPKEIGPEIKKRTTEDLIAFDAYLWNKPGMHPVAEHIGFELLARGYRPEWNKDETSYKYVYDPEYTRTHLGAVDTPLQSAEKGPTTAPKPTEAQTPAEPAKPVETPSRASDATPAVSAPDKANDAQKAALAKLGEGEGVAVTSAKMGKGGVLRVKYTMPSADGRVVEFDSTIDAEGKTSTSVAGVKAAPAPAPATQVQTNIPNEKNSSPAPAPKSNRLRRADGTDPLAEKEQAATQTQSPESPAPSGAAAPEPISPRVRKNRADKLRSLLDFARNEDGSFNPDALRNHGGNNGFELKYLKEINEHPEIVDDLGLPAEDAAALKSALKEAYNFQSVSTPHSKVGKVKESGGFSYEVKATNALKELKANPDDIGALARAQLYVKRAIENLEQGRVNTGSEDKQREDYLKSRLAEVDERVAKLNDANARKFVQAVRAEARKVSLESSMESGGTAMNVAEGQNAQSGGAADNEAPAAPAPKGGATGRGGVLGGNRHLIIDSVNGDNLTVTMKDAAGKVLVKGQKMTRAQWAALANGADAVDGDPAAPQKGDLIRRAKSDAADLPDAWTPETQKPLERIAHALRNVVTVGGKNVKVEFLNERPESDGPNAFKNSKGETVGEYDTAKGEIRLYPGATVADVVHEFTHPLVDFARAEAKAGRSEFLGKIKEIIDAERETWEQPVRDAYKGKGEEEILEEIFTHAMGEKGAKLFGKSTNTLQGRQWYKQLWEKIKGVWQDFATKMGWNKADLRGLDRMSPEEAARHIFSEMAKGRSFGDAKTGGEGTRNAAAMAKFSSGRDYVHVDTDQNLFDGKPKNTFPKIAHDAIINKFRGKVIGDAPQNAYVKTDTAGEYAYGGKPLDDISKEAKMRSSPELDNILRAGRFIEHKPDDGGHPEAVGGWDYYETIFEVGGKLFSGKVNILNNKQGRVFHDVTDVKEDTRGLMDQYGEPQAQFPGSSRNSVSNPSVESQGGVRESRRVVLPQPPTAPKIDMSKDESLKEKYLRNMSDRYDPLKRLVEEAKESAAKPSDVPDPYHEKRVQSGHNEADRHQIDVLKNKYVDFLKRHSHGQKEQEKLHEEVNMYLRARDALYRNPEMKKRLGVDDGSGMSDAQAHQILDDFKRRMRTPILDQAFKIMQEVKKTYGLQRLVDGGMLDQATADMLEKRNPDYAPQRTSRLDEEGIDRNSTRNMEAAAIKKALGRSTLSDNPVEFLFLQASDAAARTNENRTRQEMAKFVRMFPEVGKVRAVNKTSAYDLKTGKDAWIEDSHDVESENPLVVSFRENGKRMRIEFADTPRGRLLAESMRNEGVNRGPEAFDRMTRAWASTATQLSATFSGRNFQKDTVEVALNSAADTGFSGAGKFLKVQIAQMKPVVSTIREYFTKGTFGGPLGKELKEFIDAGGSIGGMGREGYEDLKDTFSRKAKGLKMAFSGAHGVKEKVEAILGVTFGKIEDFNKTIEMMSRFNNYRSRRAKGESKKEAVIGSREDSTDFNMYGQQRWLNDVYMFSNSILGGTLRSTKQLATGKNGLKVATAVLAYGFVEAAADALLNQDDDDEAEKSGLGGAKDLSERERSQTLYFRYGGKYFRIPVHGGPFSALKYTGGLLARAMLGKLSWSDAAKNAGKEWATIGTHFGGAGEIDLTNGPKGIVSSFTPSVARPVAELGMNQDFAGRHIYAPEGFDRTTPKSERGFKSTGDGYKWFARLMNKVGGGNESRSADWSWFDNPPEAYKHIVEAVGKNMIRDIMLGGETAGRAVESVAKGENRFTRDDVPFLRDVTRNVPDNSRRYYAALDAYERDKAEFKKTTDPGRRKELREGKPYLFAGKSLLDGQIDRVKELMHLERGEVKTKSGKWVEPKIERTEVQKEKYRKQRLALQARILKRLGK